jgi:hypothetical protein
MNLKVIDNRNQLGTFLNECGLTGAGAEIGVMHGGFSREVLGAWRGQKYYMVDVWGAQPKEVYRENTDGIDYEAKYLNCRTIAEEYPIVHIIRDYSINAAKLIPDGSLDWVYIDANHAYAAVISDMDAWWPKLKSGGLFAGHDYGDDISPPHWCEVKSAVDRWMREHKIQFITTLRVCGSWWSTKP